MDLRRYSQKLIRTLTEQRELTAISFGLVILIIELMHHLPQGIGILRDLEFWAEVLVYGLGIPALAWALLGQMAQIGAEQEEAAIYSGRQLAFSRVLTAKSQWSDLLQNVVQYPAAILSVQQSSLYLYQREPEQFVQAVTWDSASSTTQSLTNLRNISPCLTCMNNNVSPQRFLTPCSAGLGDYESSQARRYCVPLFYKMEPVGLLHIDLPAGLTVTSQQAQALTSTAPEIALMIRSAQLERSVAHNDELIADNQRIIAQDLHDTLAQNIGYLRFKLDQLSSTGLGNSNEKTIPQKELESMRKVAEEAYHQVRGKLDTLRPDARLEFLDAVTALVDSIQQRARFNVTYVNEGRSKHLHPHLQRQVLYICREILNNVVKHAAAENVCISVQWGKKDLTLKISDDGAGFNPYRVQSPGHFGFTIIRERAEEIKGRLTITSELGVGSTISLELPVLGSEDTLFDEQDPSAANNPFPKIPYSQTNIPPQSRAGDE